MLLPGWNERLLNTSVSASSVVDKLKKDMETKFSTPVGTKIYDLKVNYNMVLYKNLQGSTTV